MQFKKNSNVIFLLILLPLLASFVFSGCGGVGSEPVALPVPFSGSLTSDTNVLIASGNPVGSSPNLLLNLSIKKQAQIDSQFPVTWDLFDSTAGVLGGTFTIPSMTSPELTPAPGGGIKRVYDLDACATFAGDREACSSNFKCFDLPTNFEPSQELIDFSSSIPGTTPQVRKLYCSGNIDRTEGNVTEGQLLDGKLVIGSACFSGDEECIFHTMEGGSAVYIHGSPFAPLAGAPDANVVATIFTQGGITGEGDPQLPVFKIDIVEPGTVEKIGQFTNINKEFTLFAPEFNLFQTRSDAEFVMNNGSRLLVHNVVTLFHRLPELDEITRETLQTQFADEPGVTPRLLEEAVLFFNTTGESHTDLINCDPNAGEATGDFATLCEQFPQMRINFLCTTAGLNSATDNDSFMFSGVWSIVRE